LALRLSIIAARMLLTELRLGSARPMAMGMDATAIITGPETNVAGVGLIEALELTAGRGRDARGAGGS